MRKRWIFMAPLAILGILLFTFIGGEIVLQLWNWLLPPLFGWHQVTFWQALGLLALCRILFGGFGRHGGPRFPSRMTPCTFSRIAGSDRNKRINGKVTLPSSRSAPAAFPSTSSVAVKSNRSSIS